MKCEGANKNYVSIVLRSLLIGSYDVTALNGFCRHPARCIESDERERNGGARRAAEKFDGKIQRAIQLQRGVGGGRRAENMENRGANISY